MNLFSRIKIKRKITKLTYAKDTFEVLNEQEDERLDKYLSDIYPELSRSFFQKLIKENNIQVNGSNQKSNYRLKTDDIVEITIPDAVETPILPQDIPLDILYEDDDVLLVNKPKRDGCASFCRTLQ